MVSDFRINSNFSRYEEVIEKKKWIIEDLKDITESKNFDNWKEQIYRLDCAFKDAGFCGQEKDIELLNEYKVAKEKLYNVMQLYIPEFAEQCKRVAKKKREVLDELFRISLEKNVPMYSEGINELKSRWQYFGYAGRENNVLNKELEKVCEKLDNIINKDAYEKQRIENENTIEKRKIIYEMKLCIESFDFLDKIEKMKKLENEFYNIGIAIYEENQRLDKEFNILKGIFDKKVSYKLRENYMDKIRYYEGKIVNYKRGLFDYEKQNIRLINELKRLNPNDNYYDDNKNRIDWYIESNNEQISLREESISDLQNKINELKKNIYNN